MTPYERNKATSALLASLHPDLATLENAMEECLSALQKSGAAAQRAETFFKDVDPVAWSKKIEKASGNPDAAAAIRAHYDECALRFISYWLSCENMKNETHLARNKLHSAMVAAIVAHDGIVLGAADASLKPIFRARILTANKLFGQIGQKVQEWKGLRQRFNDSSEESIVDLLHRIQGDAFQKFLVDIGSLSSSCTGGLYFVTPAVPRQSVEKDLKGAIYPDQDLRQVCGIDLMGDEKSSHPASVKLAQLLQQIGPSQTEVYEALKGVEGWPGSPTSERVHAQSLLKILHNDTPRVVSGSCAPDLLRHVQERNHQRVNGATERQMLAIHMRRHSALLQELVQTLKASSAETIQLNSAVDSVGWWNASADSLLLLRTMRNNCLAADASLRGWVRNFKDLERKTNRDRGEPDTDALDEAFTAVSESLAYHVEHHIKNRDAK